MKKQTKGAGRKTDRGNETRKMESKRMQKLGILKKGNNT